MNRFRRCPLCSIHAVREKFEVCPLCLGWGRILEPYVPESDPRPARTALFVLGALVLFGLALRAGLVVLIGG